MSKIKYSIIIPVYNGSRFIESVLLSFENQTVEQALFEIIFIDDGSTDDSVEKLNKYKDDLNITIVSQENQGPAAARNVGILKAKGEIILFTDIDCIPNPNWIEEMIKPFSDPKIFGVKGTYSTSQKSIVAQFAQVEYEFKYKYMKRQKYIDFIDTYSAAYRASIFKAEVLFDKDFRFASGEDIALSYYLSDRGYKMVFNPKAVVEHFHPDSVLKYLKRKYKTAFWRILLYKKFPDRIIRDTHTPQFLKLQIILLLIFIITVVISIFYSNTYYVAGVIGILYVLSMLPFCIFSSVKRFYLIIAFPFLILGRTIVFVAGLISGYIGFNIVNRKEFQTCYYPKKRKLLIMYKYFFPEVGGIESFLKLLCNYTSDMYDVIVLVSAKNSKTRIEMIDQVHIIRTGTIINALSTPFSTMYFYYLSRINPDLIIINLANPISVLAYMLIRPPGKLIAAYHMDIVRQKNIFQLYKPILIYFLKKYPVRIVASSYKYVENSRVLRKFREKITVIPYTIEVSKIKPEQVTGMNPGYKYILFIGRLIYYKGVQYLLEAMKNVNGDCHIVIIGGGVLENKLKGQVKETGLDSSRIHFVGKISEKQKYSYLKGAEMLVLPSSHKTEAFGIVLLEAMVFGKPLVTTELGTGTSWVNQDQWTGIVVPARNSEKLAGAINKILNNPDLSRRFGDASLKRFNTEFSPEKFREKYLNLLKNV
ncbi:glycosyltransferase [Candidatus Dependentiae bacterium]|nr:glycosyltransferase [Candidatus Dependentiae bacterium]